MSFSLYGVIPSPVDDSVWGVSERFPGYLVRVDRGKNPPQSCMTEIYKVPEPGFDPRGVDIDTNGVVWTALAASSHLASFDRRKCKAITGPRKVDGSECAEGWTLYQTTGPKLKGTNIPADFHYYNWVDQHNVLGLRREQADRKRLELGCAARARSADAGVDHTARAVSARLLLTRYRRAHRRSERRLERARALRELRHALRVAHRGRQGDQGEGRQVPAAAGPACSIVTLAVGSRR